MTGTVHFHSQFPVVSVLPLGKGGFSGTFVYSVLEDIAEEQFGMALPSLFY